MDYASLSRQIIAYANQANNSNFEANIANFIENGQQRIWRELKDLGFEKAAITESFTKGVAVIKKPADWQETISLIYGSTDSSFTNSTVLFPRSYEFCINYWPNADIADEENPPLFYADHEFTLTGGEPSETGYSAFFICPTPPLDYKYQLTYLKRPELISSDNSKNILTDYYPDLLFYSCFIDALIYLRDDERVQFYQNLYQEALQSASKLNSSRYTDRGTQRDKD